MDLPQPPDDPDLKNIIDKLANFVARNGPEFENMTKQKQKDNPRFSFLFGGEHFNYYQYKMTTEQAIINQQKQKLAQQQAIVQQAIQSQTSQLQQQQQAAAAVAGLGWAPGQPPPPVLPGAPGPQPPPVVSSAPPPAVVPAGPAPTVSIPGLPSISQLQDQIRQQEAQVTAQKAAAELQVKQSEQNLAAQYQSLIQQQQVQIDEAIIKAEGEEIELAARDIDVNLDELSAVVQPIIESCTKDAISNGKNWIFNHNLTPKHGLVISQFLGKMITSKEASFESRLHLIYLINDVLHHCSRKNADDLKKSLETVVTPVFCSAHNTADEDKKQKLVKLLNLWCNNKYFDEALMEKLKDPPAAFSDYQAGLITKHAGLVTRITAEIQGRYTSLQKQHQEFAAHLNSQAAAAQQQLDTYKQQLTQAQQATAGPAGGLPPSSTTAPPTVAGPPPGFPAPQSFGPPPNFSTPPPSAPQQFDYGHGNVRPLVQDYNHGQGGGPPPGGPGGSNPPLLPLPDFSKPPPGFPALPPPPGPRPAAPSDADLMPTVPYYDLPAGLMAPLVKLEDFDYKSLDPKDIRLPPPMPPSERLLAAVEAFYSPPSHDLPRDADGWEKLGLFEFLKAKDKARRLRQAERRKSRSRSKSRSPPVRRRRYNSRSRSRSPVRAPPPPPRRRHRSTRSHSRSRSKSRSRSSSRSRSRSKTRSPSPRRRRPRSRSRSATPPSMMPMFQTSVETQLGEDNKGFSLLKKMGWGGGGLGSSEQGIVEPIRAADARDKMDMFKGIGISANDPFEQFRKNKSQGFIQRMRSRDDVIPPKRKGDRDRGAERDEERKEDRPRDKDA